ncbi:scopoletin glucosyltransferase-like [Zingiber officinale]|uniref:scopoletin glucosyltransferase-like n=1 Tax=Zingiber officinale TaxID=94328 RepID=UPI001C4C207F|nr:scopoletin glucosyltransferase-like [Zingiber officinale]
MADHPVHSIFFFPLPAAGHVIPMVDAASVFASRGATATILSPDPAPQLLADRLRKARHSGHQIDLLLLRQAADGDVSGRRQPPFLASPAYSFDLFRDLEKRFAEPLEIALLRHRPSCLVSDMFLPWTADSARRLAVPRLVFQSMGFFPHCVIDAVERHAAEQRELGTWIGERLAVPGLPHRIEMKRSQLHDSAGLRTEFSEFFDRVAESGRASHGEVVNSFYELEAEYAEHYRRVMGRRAWHIGPVSLVHDTAGIAGAKEAAAILTWLDSKPTETVVYVCFGSMGRMSEAQMGEITAGLAAAGHPYIWVTGGEGEQRSIVEEQRSVVEEQRSGLGLVVRGWAPQAAILGHRAVGGFVTHCGWNSVMEAVSAGVPMATWPLFAEQFYNEALVVDVLRVGVRVGAEVWGMAEEEKPVVARANIAAAVAQLMEEERGSEERKRRAAEMGRKAREAVAVGGSSYSEAKGVIRGLGDGAAREWTLLDQRRREPSAAPLLSSSTLPCLRPHLLFFLLTPFAGANAANSPPFLVTGAPLLLRLATRPPSSSPPSTFPSSSSRRCRYMNSRDAAASSSSLFSRRRRYRLHVFSWVAPASSSCAGSSLSLSMPATSTPPLLLSSP